MSTELRRLGKYELRKRLASGGQGEVWEAFDVQLRRFVAIKQLNAHLQSDPDSAERFEREARFIASLRHPNIVRIHDFLQIPSTSDSNISTAYMVMDYIEGPTLADYIRSTSRKREYPSGSDIVTIFTAVSLALDYAHQKGMVHRDIKPANIMLDKRNPHGKPMGEPILMDFGIAKLQGGAADTTKVLGTPLYVSPEQARGESGDKRSDLYSLGIVLYEVMTGLPPFVGGSIPAILMRHHQEVPEPPERINPAISPDVSTVILKSIAKDPDARFASASAMTSALAQALDTPVPHDLVLAPTLLALPSSSSSDITSPLAFVPPASDQRTPISPVPQPSGKRPKKSWSIALILLLIVLCLGLVSSYALFALQNAGKSSPSSTGVGQVHFLSSKQPVGDIDEVMITLKPKSIPSGQSYCAWVENHDFNDYPVQPHWSFEVLQNGTLSQPSYQNQDLLPPSPYRAYLFLITTATQCGPSATAPPFPTEDHLYYADLAHMDKEHSTFDIVPCPQSDSNNICLS